jgi:hypothetical protein
MTKAEEAANLIEIVEEKVIAGIDRLKHTGQSVNLTLTFDEAHTLRVLLTTLLESGDINAILEREE